MIGLQIINGGIYKMETLGFIFLGFVICLALYFMVYFKAQLEVMEYKRNWWRNEALRLSRINKKGAK